MPTEAAILSKLLWAARESIEMLADIVESRSGKMDNYNRNLVAKIDNYRSDKGWSEHGFGGEV